MQVNKKEKKSDYP